MAPYFQLKKRRTGCQWDLVCAERREEEEGEQGVSETLSAQREENRGGIFKASLKLDNPLKSQIFI